MGDFYHKPVLLEECLEGMSIVPDGIYLDLTFGGGGHSKEILKRLNAKGHLFAVDQDADARQNIVEQDNFTFIASNFRHSYRFIDYYAKLGKVDAILADLGVSSHHLDDVSRGFSFRADEPLLDMRMNRSSERSALNIINEYSEEDLANIFYKYGELKQSRRLAKLIVQARLEKSIQTVGELLEIVRPCIKPKEEKKQLSMLFQSIRIEVNDELGALVDMLETTKSMLRVGGRLVVITYHSLEDRIVKNFFKKARLQEIETANIYGQADSDWDLVNRKPIRPSAEELELNPRSRSAKLRIAVLKNH